MCCGFHVVALVLSGKKRYCFVTYLVMPGSCLICISDLFRSPYREKQNQIAQGFQKGFKVLSDSTINHINVNSLKLCLNISVWI